MTTECPDCKDGILNKQGSLFADPACTDCGTTEVVCIGKSTYSDCVEVNQAFECIGSDNGDSLTQVLSDINTKLCTAFETTNTILVSSDDTCAGYLSDKIASDDFELSVTNDGGEGRNCETLNINAKCPTWETVKPKGASATGAFTGKWTNPTDANYQKTEYTKDIVACTVKLRGSAQNNSYTFTDSILFYLPVGKRPLKSVEFPANARTLGFPFTVYPGIITVKADGEVSFFPTLGVSGQLAVGLNNIEFQIN